MLNRAAGELGLLVDAGAGSGDPCPEGDEDGEESEQPDKQASQCPATDEDGDGGGDSNEQRGQLGVGEVSASRAISGQWGVGDSCRL